MACYECDDVCHPLCDTPRVDNRMDAKHKKGKTEVLRKKRTTCVRFTVTVLNRICVVQGSRCATKSITRTDTLKQGITFIIEVFQF